MPVSTPIGDCRIQHDHQIPIARGAVRRALSRVPSLEGFRTSAHINMLGRYAFTLLARVARGELRPS